MVAAELPESRAAPELPQSIARAGEKPSAFSGATRSNVALWDDYRDATQRAMQRAVQRVVQRAFALPER